MPPSQGVPSGPSIKAYIWNILSSSKSTRIPFSVSFLILSMSFWSRLMAGDRDINFITLNYSRSIIN